MKMNRYIDANALLNRLPDDLPYKASVKRVLIQAPIADVAPIADTVKKIQKMLYEKVKTIYCDENERLWYDIVELEDIDKIVEEMLEGDR